MPTNNSVLSLLLNNAKSKFYLTNNESNQLNDEQKDALESLHNEFIRLTKKGLDHPFKNVNPAREKDLFTRSMIDFHFSEYSSASVNYVKEADNINDRIIINKPIEKTTEINVNKNQRQTAFYYLQLFKESDISRKPEPPSPTPPAPPKK